MQRLNRRKVRNSVPSTNVMTNQVDQSKARAERRIRPSDACDSNLKERTIRPVIQILRLLTSWFVSVVDTVERNISTYISKHEFRSIYVKDLFVNCKPHIQVITHALTIAPTTAYKKMRHGSADEKSWTHSEGELHLNINWNVSHDKKIENHSQLTMKDLYMYPPHPRQITVDSYP
jgi:hypothetical protein